MKNINEKITHERLLELGGSLNAILQELTKAFEPPVVNPRKRRDLKSARVAYYSNLIDSKIAKKKNKKQ